MSRRSNHGRRFPATLAERAEWDAASLEAGSGFDGSAGSGVRSGWLPPIVELPSGTVTFLFTDVEGSTRLLKQLGDGYGDVLAAHQSILREAFVASDGQEIDTQGDSFFVAFSRAKDAVAAAVEGQRRLAAHPWPDEAELRVGR